MARLIATLKHLRHSLFAVEVVNPLHNGTWAPLSNSSRSFRQLSWGNDHQLTQLQRLAYARIFH